MARLGEAYVRVRADLRDYDAELDAALKRSTDKFEDALNKSLGQRVGKSVADGLTSEIDDALTATAKKLGDDMEDAGEDAGRRGGAGVKKGFLDTAGSIGGALLKGIGGVLTDGLSGLPPQMRIAFGTAAILAAPVLFAAVEGAVSAGVVAGVAGLGIAFASEYEIVRSSARELLSDIREILVGAAEPFVGPLLDSFGRIDAFFDSIQGRLNNTFRIASTWLDPLTDGALAFLDLVTQGIDNFTGDGGAYVDALSDGMVFLGSAVEDVLTEFGELGDEGSQALRDILYAGADIIVFLGQLAKGATLAYDSFRDLSTGTEWWNTALKILLPGLAIGEVVFKDIDDATAGADEALERYDATSNEFIDTEGRSIRVTNAQTKALQDQADAINDLRDAQLDQISSLVDFEEALVDLGKSARDNKRAFDFKSEGGRENIDNYTNALKAAKDAATDAYLAGDLTREQAQEYYRQLAEEIETTATKNGILKTSIDKIFGAISDVIGLPPVPDKFGIIAAAAATAEAAVRELNTEINRTRFTPGSTMPAPTGTSSTTAPSGSFGGFTGHADGTISNQEHLAWISEGNTPEVVLPLNNPRRTRELAAQSGLMNVLGGDGAAITNVFIGNEQLDSRMFRVAKASNAASARMLNATPRSF